jgi:C4-type Zn-finger protein
MKCPNCDRKYELMFMTEPYSKKIILYFCPDCNYKIMNTDYVKNIKKSQNKEIN